MAWRISGELPYNTYVSRPTSGGIAYFYHLPTVCANIYQRRRTQMLCSELWQAHRAFVTSVVKSAYEQSTPQENAPTP